MLLLKFSDKVEKHDRHYTEQLLRNHFTII